MLAINPQVKIYLHTEPIDMRKSFDGLFGIIKSDLHLDVRNGGVFMFLNLRRNRIKLINLTLARTIGDTSNARLTCVNRRP